MDIDNILCKCVFKCLKVMSYYNNQYITYGNTLIIIPFSKRRKRVILQTIKRLYKCKIAAAFIDCTKAASQHLLEKS